MKLAHHPSANAFHGGCSLESVQNVRWSKINIQKLGIPGLATGNPKAT